MKSHRFTLRQLEYFVAVGETNSIARASERMNVSSPSISTSISQLEAEFGVLLFVRKHANGLTLTSGGRRLLDAAKQLLAQADTLHTLAADISGTISGPLNIGCFQTVAPLILPELRRSFETKFPDVLFRQTVTDHAKLVAQIQLAQIDACLTYDLNVPTGVQFEALADLPAYVMVSACHPMAKKSEIAPEELLEEPMVLLDLPHSSNYFLSAFQSSGTKPKIIERTKDMGVMRSMVANGFGYGLANIRPQTENSPDGKPLKFIPLSGGLRPMKLGLVTGKSNSKPRTLMAFERHCRELIGSDGVPGLKTG